MLKIAVSPQKVFKDNFLLNDGLAGCNTRAEFIYVINL